MTKARYVANVYTSRSDPSRLTGAPHVDAPVRPYALDRVELNHNRAALHLRVETLLARYRLVEDLAPRRIVCGEPAAAVQRQRLAVRHVSVEHRQLGVRLQRRGGGTGRIARPEAQRGVVKHREAAAQRQ